MAEARTRSSNRGIWSAFAFFVVIVLLVIAMVVVASSVSAGRKHGHLHLTAKQIRAKQNYVAPTSGSY
jgi:hypothetical protein